MLNFDIAFSILELKLSHFDLLSFVLYNNQIICAKQFYFIALLQLITSLCRCSIKSCCAVKIQKRLQGLKAIMVWSSLLMHRSTSHLVLNRNKANKFEIRIKKPKNTLLTMP